MNVINAKVYSTFSLNVYHLVYKCMSMQFLHNQSQVTSTNTYIIMQLFSCLYINTVL